MPKTMRAKSVNLLGLSNLPILPVMDIRFFLLAAASAVINMIIGSLWYTPKTFGPLWMKDVPCMTNKEEWKHSMTTAIGSSIVTAIVVALVTGYARMTFFADATITEFMQAAFVLWFAFVLCVRVMHSLFEQKSWTYIAITAGHDLVLVLVSAAIMFYV
jgi:small-conductance mechanosensitive channel